MTLALGGHVRMCAQAIAGQLACDSHIGTVTAFYVIGQGRRPWANRPRPMASPFGGMKQSRSVFFILQVTAISTKKLNKRMRKLEREEMS